MQINDKLRIVKKDNNNLVLEEFRDVESKKEGTIKKWCWCGYYGSMKSALIGAFKKIIFDSECEQIKDLINVIDKAEQDIMAAIAKGGV